MPVSAETHFQAGCRALNEDEPSGRRAAHTQFERAASGSDSEMLWRIVDACQWVPFLAAHWMSRAVLSESEVGGIEVDPGTLRITEGANGDVLTQDFCVAVQSDNRAKAVEALTAAADNRLWAVVEDGREIPDTDLIDANDLYSPNYVGLDPSVPLVWMDCKGLVMPYMARTVLRVVRQELQNAGIRRARILTPQHSPHGGHAVC
ncbi:hypothetical protein ACN6LM_006551 [Streptomyces sp. SAS_281]|uniref:hypothetical protein n=1 Tax=Streptomyces sp. SAS_281 TaxID=3412744 RepID=UPI00403CCDA2